MQKSMQDMLGIVQQAVSVAQDAAARADGAARAASVKAPSQTADGTHNDEHVRNHDAGALKLSSLTRENLKQHIHSLAKSQSGAGGASVRQPSPPQQLIGWALTGAIPPATSELHLASYAGFCIGDILEIDPDTPYAGTIVIAKFGSIFTVSPTRFGHQRGAVIRRLIEGTGQSYETYAAMAGAERAQPNQNQRRQQSAAAHLSSTSTGDDPDLDGWESNSPWSERERRHQREVPQDAESQTH